MQRRREPEDDAGGEANPEEEEQNSRIDRELHPVRFADVLRHRIEDADAYIRERHTGDPAEQREHHALDEQLPDDASAAGPERESNADLLRALGRSCQEQVRDVAAGNQQDEADSTHQRPEHEPDLLAVRPLVVGDDRWLDALIGLRVVAAKACRDGRHLTACLLNGDAIGQACDHLVIAHLTALAAIDRRRSERQPQVRVGWELHALRHDAHDGRWQIIDLDGLPEHAGIGGVAGLPDAVSEHDDRRSAVEIVLGNETAPELRLCTNQPEHGR